MADDSTAAGSAQGTATAPDGSQPAGITTSGGTTVPAAATAPAAPAGDAGGADPAELLADMAAAGNAGTEGGTEPDPAKALQAQVEHWKQMARKQEERAKANVAAAKELADLKKAQLTEQERLQAELAEARQQAAKAQGERLRLLAAANHDLPPEMIDLLGDGTEEEINTRAETFARVINERAAAEAAKAAAAGNGQGQQQATQPANPFFRRPVESLRPGAAPASNNAPTDKNAAFRQMLGIEQ